MKKFLTVFIFIFWFVSIASAGELITGAFGIKLGEPLDLNLLQGAINDETTDCDRKCIAWGSAQVVRPEITNKLFHSYKVFLTPTTKTVTRILAYGSDRYCESQFQGVKGVLEEKYGNHLIMTPNLFVWSDKKGRVLLSCTDITEYRGLLLEYRLREEERNEILLKERTKLSDPSGQ